MPGKSTEGDEEKEQSMKKKNKYTKKLAIDRLKRNGLLVDDDIIGSIVVPRGKHVGIKLWGAIDYLMNEHKYIFKWG